MGGLGTTDFNEVTFEWSYILKRGTSWNKLWNYQERAGTTLNKVEQRERDELSNQLPQKTSNS